MLLVDENFPAGQQRLLRNKRLRFRVLGVDAGESGTKDENLFPLFHRYLFPPSSPSIDYSFDVNGSTALTL
jgi:hypothetical protein